MNPSTAIETVKEMETEEASAQHPFDAGRDFAVDQSGGELGAWD